MTSRTMVRWSAKSSVSKDVKHALLVNEDDIRYLHSYLYDTFSDSIEYRARCRDGTEIRFDDVEELIAFENPGFRRILEIAISCVKGDEIALDLQIGVSESALDFPGSRVSAAYHIYSNDDSELVTIHSKLPLRFKQMRPWYSFLTGIGTFWALLITVFSVSAIFGIYTLAMVMLFDNQATISENRPFGSGVDNAIGTGVWAILLVIGVIIERCRSFLFPRVFIATGRQKDEWKKRGKVLNVAVGLVGIGLVVSITGGVIAQSIG